MYRVGKQLKQYWRIYNMEWWKIILGIWLLGQLWIIYEIITAPTYDDDYDKDHPN